MKVIILAGGQSSRFAPLSNKNLLKFMGKSLLERQLENTIQHLKAEEIVVVANADEFEQTEAVAKTVDESIKVITQAGQGQAAAVESALRGTTGDSDLLIINSNDVFEEDLFSDFLNLLTGLHQNKQNLLTGFQVEKYFPGGYLITEGEQVIGVVEKPAEGNEPSNLVRIVFDYFNSSKELLQALENANTHKDDRYEVALADMMKANKSFKLLPYRGQWNTLKYPWHIFGLMQYYLKTIEGQQIDPSAKIFPGASVNGNVIIAEGVKVFPGAVINGPAYIGRNTIIGNNALVRDAIVEDDCVIGFASEVARSYLAGKVWLHMNYLGDSLVDQNVSFGSTAVTANLRLDENEISVNVKGEKTNTGQNKLGSIIGSDARIGVGAKLMPGIKIGQGSAVGPGVIVSQDIEENMFVNVKQEVNIRENNISIKDLDRSKFQKHLAK